MSQQRPQLVTMELPREGTRHLFRSHPRSPTTMYVHFAYLGLRSLLGNTKKYATILIAFATRTSENQVSSAVNHSEEAQEGWDMRDWSWCLGKWAMA